MHPRSLSLRIKTSVILSSLLIIATALTLLNAGRFTAHAAGSPSVQTNWITDGFDLQRTHYNPDETTISVSNVNTLVRRWTVQTGSLVTEPSYYNGVLYQGNLGGGVTAYNALTGAVLWTQKVGGAFVSSPTIVNGVLYVGSGKSYRNRDSGSIYALNPTTGAVIWYNLIKPKGTSSLVRGAPVVASGKVYVATEGGQVFAYKAAGCGSTICSPLWRVSSLGAVESSMAYDNGVLFIGTGSGIYALNTKTKQVVWSVSTNTFVYSAPTVANGIVYIGSGDKFYALNEQTGATVWSYPQGVGSNAAVYNGVVYIGAGTLYAFDAQTGALLWTAPGTNRYPHGSVSIANGVLYTSTKHVEAFNAAGCGKAVCKPLWSSPNNADHTDPIVVNGYVYAISYFPTDRLFAYHLPK